MTTHHPLLRPGFYALIHTELLGPLPSDMLPSQREQYLASLPLRWHYHPSLDHFTAPTVCKHLIEMKEYTHE